MEEGGMLMKEVYALKENELTEVRNRMLKAVSQADAHFFLKQILVQTVSRPGKLLRPLLVLLSAGDYIEEAKEELLCAAAAAELLHIASLLHDDIIDGAEFRRGYPSVQARYGIPSALCTGDYLMIKSFSYLNDLGYSITACSLMNAALKVCDGELIQDEHQFDTFVNEEIYLDSIRGKTAAVFAECCETGCRIAKRPAYIRHVMKSYGEILGMMFQIRDDILDWTSDELFLQKPVNEDFKNGIYTIPAIFAFSNEPSGTSLRYYAKKKSLTNRDLSEIRAIVSECGGIKYAKSLLDNFANEALKLLESIPQDKYSAFFKELVQMNRNSLLTPTQT